MGLKDLRIPEEIVEVTPGGESFAVRGLNVDDIAFLVQRHGETLTAEYERFAASDTELSAQAISQFLVPLIDRAPALVSEVIACASDDTSQEAMQTARRVGFMVQVDALEKIADLTFTAAGGPKKLVETVIRLAQGTTGLLQSLQT